MAASIRSIVESLRRRRGPREQLTFIEPGGRVSFNNWYRLGPIFERLRTDPQTSVIMQAIESGPNAALYINLERQIKQGLLREEEEYLLQAASALFFGHVITDAYLEGTIAFGHPSRFLGFIGELILLDLSDCFHPEHILIEQRVDEIQRGEFRLPQNLEDLVANANSQIARISAQLESGLLERKAAAMRVKPERGRIVGKAMVESLIRVRDNFVPALF